MIKVLLVTLALAADVYTSPIAPESPSTDTVKIRVFDSYAARPLAFAVIDISTSQGVQCAMAPCPSEEVRWRGKCDAQGYAVVPAAAVAGAITLVTTASHAGELTRDASVDRRGARVVELIPNAIDQGGPEDLGFKPIKLIDRQTGAAIANLDVRIDLGTTARLRLTTNALGYVFVPGHMALEALEATSRVIAPGYKAANLDFCGACVVTRLDRSRKN